MIIDEIIPLLPIIGFGLVFLKILSKLKIILSLPEKIIYSIVIFSSILVIPLAIFGIQKFTIGFQLWPLFLALFGILALGILVYQNYKFIIPWLENPSSNIKNLLDKIGGFSSTNIIILLIILSLLFCFTIFNLILPFRDFDAIWMYIPDAMWYYRSNYIPQFDPLNFRLSTKEPFVSLLFTFSLYVTGSLSIKLIPILFIIGWSLTVFVFIDKIWHDLTKSLMGVLLFLISPFMYYILNFWVYYQEIYVSFFYSVTLLAIFSFFQIQMNLEFPNKKRMETFYLFFSSISFALSLLSKLSGWSLLILILLIYPFSKKSKIIQSGILFLLTLFLFFKSSIDFYLGIGIVILIFFLVIMSLLWKPLSSSESSIYSVKKTSWIGLIIIPLGLIGGGFWLIDTFNKFHQYSTSIIDLYVVINNLKIQYIFHGTPFHSAHFLLESAQSINFISIVGYLLVGNMFVLLWLVPKARVIFDDQVKFFILWILGFFILWLTYQSFTSIRYLSIILVPIVIVVTHGFYKLYQDVSKNKGPIPLGLVFLACFLSFTSYYFPLSPSIFSNGISTKTINDQFLLSAFNYYNNSIFYLLFALIVSILFILWFKYDLTKSQLMKIRKPMQLRTVKAFLIVIIVFIPFAVPTAVFLSVDGNGNQFNSTFVYYQRPAYTEVVNTLLNENSPSSGIIDINFPGLPIYLNQPSLDLFDQASNLKSTFPSNISDLLEMLQQPLTYIKSNYNISVNPNLLPASFSFDYVVIPNYANNYYPFYTTDLYNQTFLFPLLFQKNLFHLIYENSEFLVFKRIYVIPSFAGIVNSYLVSNISKISLLGRIQTSLHAVSNLSLQLLCSIPEAQNSQLSINSTINLYEKNSLIQFNSLENLSLSNLNSLFTVTIPLTSTLPQAETFSIANITLKLLISKNNSLITRTYGLSLSEGQLTINYDSIANEWTINTGIGLQPF